MVTVECGTANVFKLGMGAGGSPAQRAQLVGPDVEQQVRWTSAALPGKNEIPCSISPSWHEGLKRSSVTESPDTP